LTGTVVVVEVDSVVGVLDEFPSPQPENSNTAIDIAKNPAKVFAMTESYALYQFVVLVVVDVLS
jgi:hypothetical protein